MTRLNGQLHSSYADANRQGGFVSADLSLARVRLKCIKAQAALQLEMRAVSKQINMEPDVPPSERSSSPQIFSGPLWLLLE